MSPRPAPTCAPRSTSTKEKNLAQPREKKKETAGGRPELLLSLRPRGLTEGKKKKEELRGGPARAKEEERKSLQVRIERPTFKRGIAPMERGKVRPRRRRKGRTMSDSHSLYEEKI